MCFVPIEAPLEMVINHYLSTPKARNPNGKLAPLLSSNPRRVTVCGGEYLRHRDLKALPSFGGGGYAKRRVRSSDVPVHGPSAPPAYKPTPPMPEVAGAIEAGCYFPLGQFLAASACTGEVLSPR